MILLSFAFKPTYLRFLYPPVINQSPHACAHINGDIQGELLDFLTALMSHYTSADRDQIFILVQNFCIKTFKTSLSHLKMASLSIKQFQRIPCDHCDLLFNTSKTLSDHKIAFHSDILIYKCVECTYTNKEKIGLKRHIESHHDGVTHACETCGKLYSQAKSLGRHRRIAHEGLIFSCQHCSYKAKGKFKIAEHQAFTHFNGGNVVCQHCDKKFQVPKHLEVHMQTHMAFSCSLCSKKFKHKWSLTKHENMHTETGLKKTPEKYLCSVCQKSFSNVQALKQHSVVHSNVRAFSCKGCGKSFKRPQELKIHNVNAKSRKKSNKCNQ